MYSLRCSFFACVTSPKGVTMAILNIDDTAPRVEVIEKQIKDNVKEIQPGDNIHDVKVVKKSDDVILDESRKFRTKEDLQVSMLLNKDTPIETILKYPRGMKWEVDYFLQIRDINDEINDPDINLPPSIQKYNRINKLVLVLQSTIQQDEYSNISGEAIINAGFLPNEGDVFVARIAGGREAMFVIREPQTRTYNVHKAYYVSFKLFAFTDNTPELMNDIIRKTMKEYVYDRQHLLDFSAPVILKQDYKDKLELKEQYIDLQEYYLDKFINKNKNIIALPTSASVYVDTFLNSFLLKIIDLTDDNRVTNLNFLSYDTVKEKPFTIWDLILKRNKKMLKRVNKNICFQYKPYGLTDLISRNMNYLGINFLANPVDFDYRLPDKIVDIHLARDANYEHPIDVTQRRYVLSEHFYSLDVGHLSTIEKCLLEWLEGRVVTTNDLQKLLDNYVYWDTIDQYYLIPILFVLTKDVITHTFRSI